MMRILSQRLILSVAILLGGCGTDTASTTATSSSAAELTAPSLKEAYANYFLVGATADESTYMSHANILKTHFNSFTTENEMKFESLQLLPGEFTFTTADKMVNFAKKHNMAVRGHALVWHRQTPDWVFQKANGDLRSKQELLDIMRHHITTVVSHYKGQVDVWDVVNEVIMDDGSMRTEKEEADDQKSGWYGIAGETYIAEAFKAAHAADPNAKLFYNDYYNYIPARYEATYTLLKNLLAAGVPIHGVGIQCHINTIPSSDPEHQSYQQTVKNMEKAIQLYGSLGLEVQITEMDVSLYIGGYPYEEKDFYTVESIPESLKIKQAERYAAFFEMFRRNADIISSVTTWGIADDNTWLSEFDSGRADFPLLFDVSHQPKPAFFAIMEL